MNIEVARAFAKIAEILEIEGENKFRIRAYEQASQTIAGLAKDVGEIYKEGVALSGVEGGVKALEDIPDIGADLAGKIEEMIKHGKIKMLEDLSKKVPPGVLDILAIEGMGPKRTKLVWKKFGVRGVPDLERLAKSGKLNELPGWGDKSVGNILHSIELSRKFGERLPLPIAMHIAEEIVTLLKKSKLCANVEIAGSLRRMKETVGDIDILATSDEPEKVMEIFVTMPNVSEVISRGPAKSTVLLKSGIEADLRVLPPEEFGAGLYYFTGSKEHHVAVRTMAVKHDITISEYGVYKGTKEHKGKLLASRTEEEIFKALGMSYIPPEIREASGEVEASIRQAQGKPDGLPKLVEEGDIKGDLHVHSNFSDGLDTMHEMVEGAKKAGLGYIVFADHASAMGMVKGIKKDNVDEYLEKIAAARKKAHGVHVLAGAEVDIEEDGSLYLPDDILKKLDWVVASVHSRFKMSSHEMTKRLLRAIENPYVCVIGHPFTRILGRREPIQFDFVEVLKHCKKHGVALEINASPVRLDLPDVYVRQAVEHGVKLVIGSDAHSRDGFDLRYGVAVARRGWCEKKDVLNTLKINELTSRN